MEYKKKTLIWEDNNEPPKDYIWIKSDGKAYEFNYQTRTWVESKTVKSAAGSEGGSIEGAITYNEQELTESQKMQVRKNLGLYYETPEETKTVKGSDEGEEYTTVSPHLKKISDDTPEPDAIKAYFYDGAEGEFSINDYGIEQGHGYYTVADTYHTSNYFFVILEQEPLSPYASLPTGIYVNTSSLNSDKRSLEYITKATEIHQIPPKYIKDMYYEEEGVERLVKTDDQEYQIVDYSMSIGARKVSETPIDANSLIGYKFGYDVQGIEVVEELTITSERIIAGDNYTKILADPESPDLSINWAILLIPNDTTINGYAFGKGIWLVDRTYWLEVPTTTIHKIPEKYLPESDAVQCVPQELTDAQKMQARKNQDLYYEKTEVEMVLPSGDSRPIDTYGIVYAQKGSNEIIDAESLIGLKFSYHQNGYEPEEYTITSDMVKAHSTYGFSSILIDTNDPDTSTNWAALIVSQGGAFILNENVFLSAGIWIVNGTQWLEVPSVEISQIPPKYIKDMYYEEEAEGIGEKTTPEVTDQEAVAGLYKVSDDTPATTDLVKVLVSETYGSEISLESLTINESEDYYQVSWSIIGLFIVVLRETTYIGETLQTGIYALASTYPEAEQQLVYNGLTTETIIHKIPEKYLPDMPSGNDDLFIVNITTYPAAMDKTYAEILEALRAKKVVVGVDGNGTYIPTISSGDLVFATIRADGLIQQVILASDETITQKILNVKSYIGLYDNGNSKSYQGDIVAIQLVQDATITLGATLENGIAQNPSLSAEVVEGTSAGVSVNASSIIIAANTGAGAGVTKIVVKYTETIPSLFGNTYRETSALLIIKVL